MQKQCIIVDNEPLRTNIVIPTNSDVLRMNSTEVEEAPAIKLLPVANHKEQTSEYYAYIHKIRSVSNVNKGLLKSKIKHGDATYISCAYHLEGAKGPFGQEGYNDKEHGVGRTILQVIKNKQVQNVAVYIIQYYGGVRLGPHRFKMLQEMMVNLILMYQRKSKERHQRVFLAGSQDSINSTLSVMSFQNPDQDVDISDAEDEVETADESMPDETETQLKQDKI